MPVAACGRLDLLADDPPKKPLKGIFQCCGRLAHENFALICSRAYDPAPVRDSVSPKALTICQPFCDPNGQSKNAARRKAQVSTLHRSEQNFFGVPGFLSPGSN